MYNKLMKFNFLRNLRNNISFQNIGIIYNSKVENSLSLAEKVKLNLSKDKIEAKISKLGDWDEKFTFVIVIGGDGSILKAARFYSDFSVPVFGINVGKLGFLAQANPEDIDSAIKKILNKDFKIDKRLMLKTNIENFKALNEIVIKGKNPAKTSKILLEINNKKVCKYNSDGIIISTPTGSTAYNLSAGGTIVFPNLNVIIITPICPHTLNARPLIIPNKEKIQISSFDEEELIAIADGQDIKNILNSNKLIIEKNNKYAKLLLLNDDKRNFYSVLKDKLHWGGSSENI